MIALLAHQKGCVKMEFYEPLYLPKNQGFKN